jgi:uncharacterized protein (TIGR03085 family)
MTVNLAAVERAALCDLLLDVGPAAPTLCEGWDTWGLAAHLVAREGRVDHGPGLAFRPLAGYTERVRRAVRAKPYPDLIARLRTGPPRFSVFRVPGLDERINSLELFVHHEDVLRAQRDWRRRDLDPEMADALWRRLRAGARLIGRRSPVGLVLTRSGDGTADGDAVVAKNAAPSVRVTGESAEICLYLFGRRAVADVALSGDEAAIAMLRAQS